MLNNNNKLFDDKETNEKYKIYKTVTSLQFRVKAHNLYPLK